MVEQKRYRLQVRGKLILFVSVLVFSTIFLLTGIFYVSLNRAYQNWIDSSYQSFDTNIKTVVESLVSELEANYKRYENGEITELEARKKMRKALCGIPVTTMEQAISGRIHLPDCAPYI